MTKVYRTHEEKARRLGVTVDKLRYYLNAPQMYTALDETDMREIEQFSGMTRKGAKKRTFDDIRRDAMRQALAETRTVFQQIDADVRKLRRALFGFSEPPYPPPLEAPAEAHEQIRETARQLARKVGGDPIPMLGQPMGVELFILQGVFPVVPPCEVKWTVVGSGDDPALGRVTFEVTVRYPWVPRELVAGEYQRAVTQYLRAQGKPSRRKRPTPKRAMLRAFLAENQGKPYGHVMAQWNQAYPSWSYSDEGSFRRACLRASQSDK